MKKLVVATRNKGKARELAELLSGLPFQIVSLADYPDFPETEETGSTFAENAILKARAAAEHTGEMALADDSGLVIDALDGAPGIYSSRFAGEGATDADLWRKVLGLIHDVPDGKRTARFVCVAAIVNPDGSVKTCEGTCEGVIAHEPKGDGGFGYDPVFFIPELGQTMAELPSDVKNRISHRGRAIACVREMLERL